MEDFCEAYYSGHGDCSALASAVVANHSRALPTLELGDPSRPAMLFLHGWPDDGAMWANQFEFFCGPAGSFFCVAPTWWNCHPQFPTLDAGKLLWDKQIDAFKSVIDDMQLQKITLVVHDFGAALGYQLAYRYPELFRRIVSMDIGNDLTPNGTAAENVPMRFDDLEPYVQKNVLSYLKDDVNIMDHEERRVAPCGSCKMFQARIAWPYYQFVRGGEDEWHARLASQISPQQWKFSYTPSFPADIPMLFLYARCDDGTGPNCERPCSQRAQSYGFIDWVNARAGSAAVGIDADHWFKVRTPSVTNTEIAKWLGASSQAIEPLIVVAM
eukprot:TRINITY_DN32693_c0_g1_i1.p1 TRINITY_DN32693_c0_g1~~TRINITY_DN32693_c0_g1_i1.p1  ORF type:complete len:358 (-),score=43.44 TRINITY_DN32693_c0_g1_i1:354-1334(-)